MVFIKKIVLKSEFPYSKLIPMNISPVMKQFVFTLLLLTSLALNQSVANIIYVDANNASLSHDGTSWETAYSNLQDAFLASLNLVGPDEIWVAMGTYRPATCVGQTCVENEIAATFNLLKDVSLFGGFEGIETMRSQRDPWVNLTILSGDLLGNDDNNDLRQAAPSRADNSYHVVTGDLTDSTAVLDGFVIRGGNARSDIQNTKSGGGMINNAGSPIIRNCVFEYNTATAAGALDCSNGGSPIIVNSVFRNNFAEELGGAVSVFEKAKPVFLNCTFYSNMSGRVGGASYSGDQGMGATTIATFTNCTFFNNSSIGVGPVHSAQLNSTLVIENSIIWGNKGEINLGGDGITEPIQISDTATFSIGYSIVESDTGAMQGIGNLNLDPMFTNPDSFNLALQVGSPAIDAGGLAPLDLGDLDGDSLFTEILPLDLRGKQRVIDVDSGGIDMGAIESTGFPDFIRNLPVAENLAVRILRNPITEGDLAFEVKSNVSGPIQFSLLNLTGTLIGVKEVAGIVSNTSRIVRWNGNNLAPGIYILRAIQAGTQKSYKILVR